MEFSEDQLNCIDEIECWKQLFTANDQVCTLGGYAGCGKTTVINHLAGEWPHAAVVCPTGKAAQVLRAKGTEARTIHSLIYYPDEQPDGTVRFKKKHASELNGTQQIIVDEASMVNCEVHDDLLSYGLPVLYVGDHGQLEPVGVNPELMKNPKLRLEKIHRQAMDNPILRLATAFREGRRVPYWSDPQGRLQVRPREDFVKLQRPDIQMICGFNATRHAANTRMRQELKLNAELICPGERIICLQNNRLFGIFNGQQFKVLDVGKARAKTIVLTIETDDGEPITMPCHVEQFGQNALEERRQDCAYMDYGYCLTAHKAQGSEFAEVLVLEEISKHWDARRWQYTVATRAKERLIYCR
jgi:exodeoxyribonuclease V